MYISESKRWLEQKHVSPSVKETPSECMCACGQDAQCVACLS